MRDTERNEDVDKPVSNLEFPSRVKRLTYCFRPYTHMHTHTTTSTTARQRRLIARQTSASRRAPPSVADQIARLPSDSLDDADADPDAAAAAAAADRHADRHLFLLQHQDEASPKMRHMLAHLSGASFDVNTTLCGEGSIYCTPLFYAADDLQCLDLVLGMARLDVNARPLPGATTALFAAASCGNVHGVERFLQHPRIDVNLGDGTGRTPLFVSAEKGHDACVALLLRSPAVKVNQAEQSKGRAALGVAAANGHAACVRLLLDAGAINPNQTEHDGKTALHLAGRYGHQDCLAALVGSESTRTNDTPSRRSSIKAAAAVRGKDERGGEHVAVSYVLIKPSWCAERRGEHVTEAVLCRSVLRVDQTTS